MKKDKEKEHSKIKWFIQIFITTFILSMAFSYISNNGVTHLNIISSVIILIIVIAIGILFDIVGVAVTVAKEHEFHAKATKKVTGAKTSIKLIKNAAKVANICADVIGDICGVLSGSISALIAAKIAEKTGVNLQFVISASVAAITVGGKAIGKEIANRNSTQIVHYVGIVLNKIYKCVEKYVMIKRKKYLRMGR